MVDHLGECLTPCFELLFDTVKLLINMKTNTVPLENGNEGVFGGPAWWAKDRPVHGFMWAVLGVVADHPVEREDGRGQRSRERSHCGAWWSS